MKKLVDRGIFATINQTLDAKLATDIARDFGASTSTVTYEEEAMQDVEEAEEPKDLHQRVRPSSPSWATSITARPRCSTPSAKPTSPARKPAASRSTSAPITWSTNGQKIVFIDTPGHEAFTRMRARGAKVTDIVVLVVAADDGVMPQTLEAIDHATRRQGSRSSSPSTRSISRTPSPTASSSSFPTAACWPKTGAATPSWCRFPRATKQNLDLLLEMILLVAELQDLKANPARPAMGTVLEAKLDRGRGPVATVLVRNGTLRVGDYFICGTVFGRVRAMLDDRGEADHGSRARRRRSKCSASKRCPKPATISRWSPIPPRPSRSSFSATDKERASRARQERPPHARTAPQADGGGRGQGTAHHPQGRRRRLGRSAARDAQKLSNDKVKVRVIHSGVGAINESDVLLASASNAIMIGFNVRPERNAAAVAEQEKVDIRLHTIIYKLIDEIKKAMTGLLAPVFKEVYKGKAEVRETFPHSQGRRRGRLPGHGWQLSRAIRRCACCATTWWCTPARSARCAVSKTTSAK